MHMLVIGKKKIYWNLVNVSQSDSSTISTESLAGLKMHNIWSATLFFLLVAFEFYYFTRKNTEEWIILHCDFICSNSPYLSSSRLIWPGER